MPSAPAHWCLRCRRAHVGACPAAPRPLVLDRERWARVRRRQLAEHPWCQCPECVEAAIEIPAVDVDHILSVREAPHLAYSAANLRSLAHGHHARKTSAVDGGHPKPSIS